MRIAIVNDNAMAVEAMRRVLAQAAGHELAWVAHDGVDAVERCAGDTPDLILMDLIMPKMDGVEAIRRIMAKTPCAIVIVTASVNQNIAKVFEAMGAGALDAVNTPSQDEPPGQNAATALLAKIQIINRLIGPIPNDKKGSQTPLVAFPKPATRPQLIAIGASAGGPVALATILSQLPADFSAPIVIVQHVDVQFAPGLANWLAHETKMKVRLAREGDQLQPGIALLAGTESHLVFTNVNKLGYSSTPVDAPYSPSIDVFFNSIPHFWRGDVVGVLLTGMGRDGAEGLKMLHRAGHYTIVQDQATSAVFGMPKIAIEMKAASEILPVDKIGERLISLLTQKNDLHG